MTDSNSPQPTETPRANKQNRKGDTPTTNRIIVVLIFATVLLAVFYPKIFGDPNIKKLTYSEFQTGLKKGTYDTTNVHELTIGQGMIYFQDQPKPKDGGTADPAPKLFQISAATMSELEQKEFTDLLTTKQIPFDYIAMPADWQPWAFLLLIGVPCIIMIAATMRRIGGAGGALAFGRSRGKLYAQSDVKTTFKDVAGIDEAVEELKEIVEFLRSPGKYQALGGRIPRGVLLVGPPGTGKTLLAKAVAGEAGVPFVSLSGSDFVEMFVGVGAARVRDMFQQAAAQSPCIIFIDELDALGKARSSGVQGSHEEREQTLNALLVEMDGFGSDQSVIVMGATNRPETLDSALMRPGRFDRHVLVDRPDIKGRESILKVHSKKVKIDESVNLAYLARLTPGFSGADLANLVNEAALLAARKDKKCVTMREFEESVDRVIAGLEKNTRIIPEDEKRRTAYHECGHALVASSLPASDPVHKISIIPRGMTGGLTMMLPETDRRNATQSELTAQVCCLLGGIAAEQVVYNETSTGAQNDLQRASEIVRRMVTEFGMSPKLGRVHYSESRSSPFLGVSSSSEPAHSEETIREIDLEVKRIIDECNDTALEILQRRRKVLEQMTQELMEVEVMDQEHLRRILAEHYDGPQIVPGTIPSNLTVEPKTEDGDSSAPTSAIS